MKLSLNAAERAFEKEVSDFLSEALPVEIADKVRQGRELEKGEYVHWQKTLFEQGWAAPDWPFEHGGTGWTPKQKYIWAEQYAQAGAPEVIPFGLNMVGPLIIEYGTDAQRERLLPSILSSEAWWCQGYSEPNAGSDLASLTTSAVREGDNYKVNGIKSWVTYAQHADWMFCLVRTGDAKKTGSEGISFLLIPMDSEGIEITPVETMDGYRELNQVVFKDVQVSIDNLIGEEGEGWKYAKYLLHHERASLGYVPRSRTRLERLKSVAEATQVGNSKLIDDQFFAAKLARIEIELNALQVTEYRLLTSAVKGSMQESDVLILKLVGAEVIQTIDELFLEAAGLYGLPVTQSTEIIPESAWGSAAAFLNSRKASLFGGSSEILKNVICKELLDIQQKANWGLT